MDGWVDGCSPNLEEGMELFDFDFDFDFDFEFGYSLVMFNVVDAER